MAISSLGSQSLSQLYSSVYKKMDADSSGGISTDELSASLSSGKTGTAATAQAEAASKLFSAMDSDEDGSLSETEVSGYFQNNLSVSTMTSLMQTQESGRPSGPPPGGPPPSGGPQGGGSPPSLSDIDSDEDGSISKTEMERYSTATTGDTDTTKADAIFDSMDTNQDGTVSADEKTAFDEQMAANRPASPSQAASTTSTDSASGTDSALKALTSQWLQSLYASLSEGASSLTESATSGSTLSVSA